MNASRVSTHPASAGTFLSLGFLSLALAAIGASAAAQTIQPAMRALSGANQDTTYGSTFAKPLTVWVTDSATQQSLSGIRVEFTAATGIGLSDSYAVTDEKGLASVTATGLAATTSSAAAMIPAYPSTKVNFDGLLVKKAILTVVPIDMQAKVGSELPAITDYTIQGFVHGDTEATANISGTPVLSTTANTSSPHANYAIKGSVGTLTSPNYAFVAGFGTMAVLGNGKEAPAETELAQVSEGGDGNEVRPAIEEGASAIAVAQPAFLAGLRGTSGVFVRAAIWQSSPTTASSLRNANTRSAMPKLIAARKAASEAPVRAAALPASTQSAGSAVTKPVNTRAIMPVAATAERSFTGSAIRKAFNPPGMN
jgi:hypothetical protein